jgi:hypothetical protein
VSLDPTGCSVSYRKNEVLLPGASLRIFATLRF